MENAASAKHINPKSARHKGEFRKVPLGYTNAIPRCGVLYFEKRGRIYVLKE
jgi:hypothetical protein